MKKKFWMVAAALCISAAFALGGCSAGKLTPYEIATERGYNGSEGAWLTSLEGQTSQARLMYNEAVADGYTGSYVDFLKEIGRETDDSISVNRALTSTVAVQCVFERPATAMGEDYASGGAGVVYTLDRAEGDAYIVTNYHVVYSASSAGTEKVSHISDDIKVYLYGDTLNAEPVSAEYVGGSMSNDIAVLRVEDSPVFKRTSVHAALLADSDAVTVGERVYVVGNPNLAGTSVVSGIVSVDAEYINILMADNSSTTSMLEMRTDAPVNHGNSGGGMYDADGRLLGIVNARSEATGVEHFGYAIPSNYAIAIAQNIIDNSAVNHTRGALRAMLGITVQRSQAHSSYDEDSGKLYQTETVSVSSVTSGVARGKLEEGDVLFSIKIGSGEPKMITRMHMVANAMFNVRLNDVVTIVFARGSEIKSVELKFDSRSYFDLYA